MKTFNFEPVEDGPRFRAYAAGCATSLKARLDALTDQDKAWLSQFADDPAVAIEFCLESYALDQITARLTRVA